MLIPKNISPDECIYYKATFVIKVLLEGEKLTVSELFCAVNRNCKMSFYVFLLCLDWLYLIGSIKYNNDPLPKIILCS